MKKWKMNYLLTQNYAVNKKNKNIVSEHDKYSDDNLRRKCINIIKKIILDFINEKINTIYEG